MNDRTIDLSIGTTIALIGLVLMLAGSISKQADNIVAAIDRNTAACRAAP